MNNDENKNLILAVVLSGLVMFVWYGWFQPEPPAVDPNSPTAVLASDGTALTPPTATSGGDAAAPSTDNATQFTGLDTAPRIAIETAELTGSITLFGGRIDDLQLNKYLETQDDNSDIVTLLSPAGTENPYYTLFGWAPAGDLAPDAVPNATTLWSVENSEKLTIETPITLKWDNGSGLIFRRMIAIDDKFMFTITQSVENTTDAAQRAQPYGIIARQGEPDLIGYYISHEGVVRMSDGKLQEVDYDDMTELDYIERENGHAEIIPVEKAGWIGFSDKNWMVSLVPNNGFSSVVKYDARNDNYTTEARLPTQDIPAGATVSIESKLYAGAKEWATLRAYENEHDVGGFLNAIDWGIFSFLTKPIFWLLHTLNEFIGNMGWAIIALTLIIKAALLPLAYKSYVSMARMKTLQPEMEALKERCGDDKQKMQKEMMALYKKEKVNPAAGCLPILMQIPIFFSLYKVIFVTLELRQAPWLGWLTDLSMPDPSSILNLFGLLPFAAPDPSSIFAFVSLGILPIILGISMWLQQKLNPTPTDATQAMIFAWMPWVFMFMLGNFASGLVLYWIANNTITFTQQYLIMRSQGARPDVFGNIKKGFARKDKPDTK